MPWPISGGVASPVALPGWRQLALIQVNKINDLPDT